MSRPRPQAWVGLGLLILLVTGVLAGCGASEQTASPTPEPRLPFLVAQEVANPQAQAIGIPLGGCGRFGDVDLFKPDLRAVDGAIVLTGGAHRLYKAAQLNVFYGPVEEAAAAFGGTALFVGPQERWIRTAPGKARAIVAFTTPAGREVWILLHTAEVSECGLR